MFGHRKDLRPHLFKHTKNSISFSLVLLRHYTCTKLKVTSETVENATQRAGVCLKEAVLQVHGLKKRQLIR